MGRATNGSIVLLAIVLAGCEDIEPHRAPGFRPEGLLHVTVGTTREELVSLFGAPLPKSVPVRTGPYEVLYYAQRGGRWWLGEYRSNVRGDDCTLWLQNGRVVAAHYLSEAREKLCQCGEKSCKPDWAQSCITPPAGRTRH